MRPMLLIAAAGLAALAATTPQAQPRREMKPLVQVDTVQVRMVGRTAVIRVRGMAPTPGYRGWTLRPVTYIQAPPDGIYDFTAVGIAPDGITPMHTVPVQFTYRWDHVGRDVRGVRVHANAGAVEARLRRSR